ncbi:patched family protein [Striga asiatica]|uniref:Patched family protein n=1 Tax=Striga asiatica TaxID=4170 RepID=A0A5A7QAW3_STRAF|nr:patched family protein [Striga asiatica]
MGLSQGREMGRAFMPFMLAVLFVVAVVSAERSATRFLLNDNIAGGERHSEGYCAMYDICGKRSDGKVLNCPVGTPAVKPDELLSQKVQSLCPTITGNVCCTAEQFDVLRTQIQQAIPFVVGCPACLRNFLNLFCELTCSPNQSQFINVTSISRVGRNSTVDGIDYYVTDAFGKRMFESCKDVKFGSMNSRAIDFIGAGAKNFSEWFAFIGRRAELGLPGSPYAINFLPVAPKLSGMRSLNVSSYSCGDTSLGCSCGDCPSAPACSSSEPVAPPKQDSCSVTIGSLNAKCVEVAMAIVYIVVASIFLGWGFLHRKRTSPTPQTKPIIVVPNGTNVVRMSSQKNDNIPMQMFEDVPQINNAVQLSILQGYMSRFYRKYGTWVARNPMLVLCLSIATVAVLCLGLIRFQVETRPEKLWVGPGSRAAKEKEFFDNHLAPFYRIEQVDSIRANNSGSMVSLTDICLKPLGKDCATQSVLQAYVLLHIPCSYFLVLDVYSLIAAFADSLYFKMDPQNYDSFGGLDHIEYCFQHFSSAETCASAFKAPLDPSTAVGGFPGNNYLEASAFVVTYPVNNEVDKEGNGTKRAEAWEKAFIQLAKEELLPMVQSRNLTLAFSSESSIEEELKRESTADAITILISYLVMFAYISFTLGDAPRFSSYYVSSKVLLGLSGVTLVVLSVLGSVGFFSAVGIKSTMIIMEVIPFLVLAVGVDNMCILVHAVKRQQVELPIEGRISNALVEVGPSITLASLSEVLAFAVGSFIPMPAIRVFSMFAALAVLLDFLLQVTSFVSLIVFDFLRAENNRVDCCPCIKVSGSNVGMDQGSHHQQKPSLLVRYMKDIHASILSLWFVKLLVVCAFGAFTLASIALCTRIQPGLEQQIVLPRDSYLQGYFSNISEYLRIGPPLYFVVQNYNFSSESRQTNQLCSISQCDSNSLLNEIARASLVPESSYIAKPAASWLDDFLVWLSPEAFGCCRKFTNGSYCPPDDQCFRHSELQNDRPSTAQFREKLPWFLNALPSADCAKGGNGAYTTNVELKGLEDGIIRASAFRTYHTPLNKQADFINSMRAARDFSARMSDSLKIDMFPYSVFYMFFEQYLDIWKTALINLAIAIGAVFVVCFVITCSVWTSAIILLVLAMIVVDLLGIMAILNIQLNALSVVNLVMSVGIAVEFCVHITHAFLVAGGDRNQRMKESLVTVGASVFSGITLTKLVGVLVLCFSRTEVFVVYYFKMYLALVLLGFLHGLVFLPVILSMFGPPSRCVLIEKQEDRPSTSSQF